MRTCGDCGSETTTLTRGLCSTCYGRVYQRETDPAAPTPEKVACRSCKRRKAPYADGQCRECYCRRQQRTFASSVHAGTAEAPYRHNRLCGYELATLALTPREEELERRRRVKIYTRHRELYGKIRWGEVPPADDDAEVVAIVRHGREDEDDGDQD